MNQNKKDWNKLLNKFINLGGIAFNISHKIGKYGWGIFPENPNLKMKIITPSSIMVNKKDVFLDSGKLRIKDSANYSKELKDFFNFYQDYFSWCNGGKEMSKEFENNLRQFPQKLKQKLAEFNIVDISSRHNMIWDDVILNNFLNSRVVRFKGSSKINPIWDLVNHDVRSLPFLIKSNSLETPNMPISKEELTFSYGYRSPLKRLFMYGFFEEESKVFSFPFELFFEKINFTFICDGFEVFNDEFEIKKFSNAIRVKGLPIGDKNMSNFPRLYIHQLLKINNILNISENLFEQIKHYNLSKRIELINYIDAQDNKTLQLLDKTLNYECEIIRKS
tara:strand:- start:529 stop:1530 length:1002 start_codon:yes stop_codon:yes gene_type:complete